jgi:hypothetical protein
MGWATVLTVRVFDSGLLASAKCIEEGSDEIAWEEWTTDYVTSIIARKNQIPFLLC